jgi:hypothetical protein
LPNPEEAKPLTGEINVDNAMVQKTLSRLGEYKFDE